MFLHKIRVIAKGIKEFISHSWTKEKLYLAYHLKDILEKGDIEGKEEKNITVKIVLNILYF